VIDRDATWKRQLVNPILVKCARSRLRWQHLVCWGIIAFTITAFVSAITYFPMVEHDIADTKTAARSILMPVIILQSIVLMLSGTGAVASGMARERMNELVDYHRMTPMSPRRKLVGFLFGLPAREYFLFALTLPYVAFAVIVGEFPLQTLGHFYVVFFSSVMVYHLVGLVAGMVVPKPYFALLLSQGLVLVLYLILPQLSRFGITFFEFLTIRPTLLGLVAQEIQASGPGAQAIAAERFPGLDGFRYVPVFDTIIHPTLYTFIVQTFLISTLVIVLLRKWRNEQAHLYSKSQALFAFGGLSAFVLASVWAMLSRDDMIPREVLGLMADDTAYPLSSPFQILLLVSLAMFGVAAIGFSGVVTASKLTYERGIRRAYKLGRNRLSFDSDAASGLGVTFGMIGIMIVCAVSMVWVTVRRGGAFDAPPPLLDWIPLAVTVAGAILFAQGLRERFGMLFVTVGLFVTWCIPFFVGVLLMAGWDKIVLGMYISMPCPAMAWFVGMQEIMTHAMFAEGMVPNEIIIPDIKEDARSMMVVSALFHGGLAIAIHLECWRSRRQISTRERLAWREREDGAAEITAV
jgi:hypothetical protein